MGWDALKPRVPNQRCSHPLKNNAMTSSHLSSQTVALLAFVATVTLALVAALVDSRARLGCAVGRLSSAAPGQLDMLYRWNLHAGG